MKSLDGHEELNCNYSLNRAARALHIWSRVEDDASWDPADSDNSDEWEDDDRDWDTVYHVHIFRKRVPGPPPAYQQIPQESADGRVRSWVSSQQSPGPTVGQPISAVATSQPTASRATSQPSASLALGEDPAARAPSYRSVSRASSQRSAVRTPSGRSSATPAGSQSPSSPWERATKRITRLNGRIS